MKLKNSNFRENNCSKIKRICVSCKPNQEMLTLKRNNCFKELKQIKNLKSNGLILTATFESNNLT